MKSSDIKQRVIEHVRLLAHPNEQLEYAKKVPLADVPGELLCGFCDELYSPIALALSNSFTDGELKELAHLYGLLVEAGRIHAASVTELLKAREWRAVVALAKEIDDYYSRMA